MKTINIFGKNMPIIAILMALLVIGTASAAVFYNYATLEGEVEITSPLKVTTLVGSEMVDVDVGATVIVDVITTGYPYDVSASFGFNNSYGSALNVSIYMELNDSSDTLIYNNYIESYPVVPGSSSYTATLDIPDQAILDGTYTYKVIILPETLLAESSYASV